MSDNIYSADFIDSINAHYSLESNLFCILKSKSEKLIYVDTSKYINIVTVDVGSKLDMLLRKDNEIMKEFFQKAEIIFIHYLGEWAILYANKYIRSQKLVGITWGGDIYCHQKFIPLLDKETEVFFKQQKIKRQARLISGIKNIFHSIERKKFGKRVNTIGSEYDFDFEVYKKIFGGNPTYINFRYYNPSLDIKINDNVELHDDKHTIILGNSRDSSNNHISILNALSKSRYSNFRIVCPLSYGKDKEYSDYLIEYGKKLFGERFVPITEYMNREEYTKLLTSADIGIFNHNRQQALGNIIIMLSAGKQIYLQKTSIYYDLIQNGIPVKLVEELDVDLLFDNKSIQNNEGLLSLLNTHSEDYMLNSFHRLLIC